MLFSKVPSARTTMFRKNYGCCGRKRFHKGGHVAHAGAVKQCNEGRKSGDSLEKGCCK